MRHFLSVFSISLLVSLSIPIVLANFEDIKSPVLLEAVTYLNEKGIIKGYPDGTFRPNQIINRAEALKIIFESRGIAVEEETNSGFPDVDQNQWFAKYVASAKKLSLINGYADGTYKPTQFVNKAEFLKISMLAQSYYQPPASIEPATSQFTDLSRNEWYVPYVAFALENDFLDKVSKLSPTAGITRGEAALIIYRVAKRNEGVVQEPPTYLSCETCVNGVDLSQYEWSSLPFVKIEDGRVFVDGSDQSNEIRLGSTDKNILLWIEDAKLKYIPFEEKLKVDKLYPDLHARAIGIRGGIQDGDKYLQWRPLDKYLVSKDGVRIHESNECGFERAIASGYQSNGYPPFETWIGTDDAKPFIYDVIYSWLKKHPEEVR